jgi:hypothetical protein
MNNCYGLGIKDSSDCDYLMSGIPPSRRMFTGTVAIDSSSFHGTRVSSRD